jgi:hypothetical protein
MRKLLILPTLLIIFLGTAPCLYAETPDHPMTFKLSGTGGNCSTCQWIAAEGTITENTPEAFKTFVIHELHSPGGIVALNSLGGNLLGALKLGILLRELGFETTVADTTIALTDESVEIDGIRRRTQWEGLEPGQCASACAWAFAGGTVRYLNYADAPGQIGLHQFYDLIAILAPGEKIYTGSYQQNMQAVQGMLINYLKEMEVDTQFLMKANMTPPGEMYWVSEEEAREWNLDNSGYNYTPWELVPDKNGLSATSMYISSAHGNRIYKMYCLKNDSVYVELGAPNGYNKEFAAKIYNKTEVQIGYGNHKIKSLDHFSLVKDDSVFFLVKAPASDFRRLISGNAAQDLEILWSYPNVLSWYGYGSRFPAPSADMLDVLLRNCAG